jgi:hypothetical protein
MPEAKLLFGIASLVILGLVAWVVAVLRVPRETWAREGIAPQPHPYDRHPDGHEDRHDGHEEPELIGGPEPEAPPESPPQG